MRRSTGNCSLIIADEVFYGISLGWDYCAEHEWGIADMRRKFGIGSDKSGIDNRKITKGNVYLVEDDNLCVLTSDTSFKVKAKLEPKPEDYLPHDLKYLYNDLETAWDKEDFCVVSKDKESFQYLRELAKAFENQNVALTFLKSELPAFSNSSLSLLICDKLPNEVKQEMENVDNKSKNLIEYEKSIGVTALKEKVRGNGYKGEKYFIACSPNWIDYEDPENREKRKKEIGTIYDIQFWVNYSDDDDNFGWYKAEDIIQWLSTPGLKLKSLNKKETV